jgi:putative membrane protein
MSGRSSSAAAGAIRFRDDRKLQVMVAGYAVFWLWMLIKPKQWSNWWLENLLVVATAAVLIGTFKRFRFSHISYGFILIFMALHTYGAHYAYTSTPIDTWMHRAFGFKRDNFDRVVHASFGLLAAYPIWEFGVRRLGLKPAWSYIMTPMLVLAFGAFYELIEMWVALLVSEEVRNRFVGTQGDIWDSQHDMEVALYGAIAAMLVAWGYRFLRRRKRTDG